MDTAWTDGEGCTLPPDDRTDRLDAFDALFAEALPDVVRDDTRRARLVFRAGPDVAARVTALADAEAECCSFFTLAVEAGPPVTLDIEVPAHHAPTLARLLDRAGVALEVRS